MQGGRLIGGDSQLVCVRVMPDLLHVIPIGDDAVLDGVFQRQNTYEKKISAQLSSSITHFKGLSELFYITQLGQFCKPQLFELFSTKTQKQLEIKKKSTAMSKKTKQMFYAWKAWQGIINRQCPKEDWVNCRASTEIQYNQYCFCATFHAISHLSVTFYPYASLNVFSRVYVFASLPPFLPSFYLPFSLFFTVWFFTFEIFYDNITQRVRDDSIL